MRNYGCFEAPPVGLNSLKLKIENLRESLKRPNEILLKYRDLKRKSFSSRK